MSRIKRYISSHIGVQFILVSAIALFCAFSGHYLVADVVADWVLFDERFNSYWEEKSAAAVESFQDYITQERMTVRQALSDVEWSKKHPDIFLFTEPAFFQDEEIFDIEMDYEKITCSDGEIFATSYSPGELYFAQWNTIGLVIGLICFLAVLLPYIIYIIRRIKRLYQQVMKTAQNQQEPAIFVKGNDEIAALGHEIEYMRVSLVKAAEREVESWRANEQLITSLSHDIRTPLTKLIGYIDILSYKKVSTTEEKKACIQKASEKAQQLKELTDELFCRFATNSYVGQDIKENVNGPELLSQLLYEEGFELQEDGFLVDNLTDIQGNYQLYVCVGELHRAFDNIFSNLRKYASSDSPIKIVIIDSPSSVMITVSNRKRERKEGGQSHKIGIPTIRNLIERNGGHVIIEDKNEFFSVSLILPKAEGLV